MALLKAIWSDFRHETSGPPQLMEMTEGLFTASWAALVIAWMNPWVVLGAKNITIFAFGAMDAATSMSSITSPSASEPGVFDPPSTETSTTSGAGRFRPWKYV